MLTGNDPVVTGNRYDGELVMRGIDPVRYAESNYVYSYYFDNDNKCVRRAPYTSKKPAIRPRQ